MCDVRVFIYAAFSGNMQFFIHIYRAMENKNILQRFNSFHRRYPLFIMVHHSEKLIGG